MLLCSTEATEQVLVKRYKQEYTLKSLLELHEFHVLHFFSPCLSDS